MKKICTNKVLKIMMSSKVDFFVVDLRNLEGIFYASYSNLFKCRMFD